MTVSKRATIAWSKITNLGAGKDQRKNSIIALMNQIAFMGAMVCLVMASISTYLGLGATYLYLTLILGSVLVAVIAFNAFNQFEVAKFLVSGVLPALISLDVVLIGGNFGEESILMVILFLTYIFYENEPEKRIRYYVSLAFFFLTASTYLFYYPPVYKYIDNPYDNIIIFAAAVLWLFMVIWLYQKKIYKQQKNQDRLIGELKDKNANLEKTTEELEQFTYIASHDLKSPLRTIISFLDLIKRDVNRKKFDDLLSKIEFAKGGAEQMNFLVTDILEYSKIKNENKSKKKMVSLQAVAEKVKVNLTELIQKQNVELYIFPLPDFFCNETEMTVLFQNFIENGIKYNEESTPTIFVKSRMEDNHLLLQFIDNGIGIEEVYFDKIFQFFKRLHTNEVYQGTGLGLGLCKKIIDGLQGTVTVESMLNVGTTFTIKLPIIHSAEVPNPAIVLDEQKN